MAKKKASSSKPVASAPKEPVVKKAEAKITTIASEDEAKAYVKERFKNSPGGIEYVVMENCNIFYGINKAVAIKYAKDFDLKYFEVKA